MLFATLEVERQKQRQTVAQAKLPPCVARYRTTATFTEHTIPSGFAKAHRTQAGVWGRIVVLEGRLAYRVGDERVTLDPATPGIVEPQVIHAVEPLGKVKFCIEFYRRTSS